ncbi:uncharacterized protein AB675_1216 [Cyphellophora attinorum]|uniref:DNA endonuclease activator Ctp1 C-terminal domain-containing protein n=1 Tax=Cyphellophora attinorum TaxID=1664694 RepID=A0A0N1HM15_9EURO|nr:uncharacterized protein AB675_1216 [Phialophora attinorum]KPI35703.1 hypothetical protein AB675_1216 [Phialophora attinorum]
MGDVTPAVTGAHLQNTLVTALSQGQVVAKRLEDQQKQLEDQQEHIEKLFTELASKQAEIDVLKRELRTVQTKERKWRLQNPHISSPVILSDEIEHTPRPATPVSPARQSSPTPHVQVESSPPPRKRQRTRESTPLREVQSTEVAPLREVHNTKSALTRVGKAIAAIPSLTEDGEHTTPKLKSTKSPTNASAASKDAHSRLGGLLAAPAPTTNALQSRRPTTGLPTTRAIPAMRKSSSDVSEQAQGAKRSRFKAPKPQDGKVSLRERPVGELSISDFKLNPEYVEEWDRPGGQRRKPLGAILGDELSDDDLLREVLGQGADERIAAMTEAARINLIHDARLRKIAEGFAHSKQQGVETGAPLQPNYWSTEFPPSQEDQKSRAAVAVKVREEVVRRYQEALRGNGRWHFRDEVN